ncbi:MAG TPA: MarR family winged helix-turn-helix transcriptional regulator [Nitrososphaerales archaeon]|nr:MarR family winged helix-turn-helix transcriptional regulator [Nitrososphaerales archaeon]
MSIWEDTSLSSTTLVYLPRLLFNLGGTTNPSSGSPSSSLPGFYGFLPFGGFGITALIAYTVLSRVGGTISSAVASGGGMSRGSFNRNPYAFNPFMQQTGQFQPNQIPEKLPQDITAAQYVILREYRQGSKNPKEVAKVISMDKKDVERETSALIANGYLSNGKKLTSKALELLH